MEQGIKLQGVYTFTIRDAKTGAIKRVQNYCNLIPTVGRALLINQLTDTTPTNTPVINYTAVGTGTTAPDNADTTLETETYRKTVASLASVDNIGYVSAFYTAAEVTGTFKEAGIFVDGTGTVDTGVLLSRVAINVTKSNSETLTIDYTITIS